MSQKAIIIGSGIGGIATAIRLAVQGFEVEVFEKNNYPGGKLSAFKKDGYHFDAGPSLFTQPENIEELFASASTSIESYLSYQPVEIACKYFYENGKIVNAFADKRLFEKDLIEQLGESPGTLTTYLHQSEKLYNNVGSIFLNHSLHKKKTWLNNRILSALKTIKFPYLFRSLHRYNQHNFSSVEAVQLFDRYATYNGSNPYKAPGMLSLIPHLEQNTGTFYPKGGMISITNALYSLALSKAVQFHFNSPVDKILHRGGQVTGVMANGKTSSADVVVSNADIYFTYKNLLDNKNKATKVLSHERSSSAVIFYWGIKKEFSQLGLHNIFFSSDYKAEFDNIFQKKQISNDPTIYINITSKMENEMAPQGRENWFVMVNAPANTGQNWSLLKENLRAVILKKLTRMLGEEIAGFIETEHTLDPISIEEQTLSFMGSLYGSSSNTKLAAFLRHANFTSAIKRLYFCGGSVHPGGGIPLCLKSAKIVSDLIAEDYKD
jgi:phytoene desaturase